MEIQFQSTGENSGFENWLKGFKEISDSLLIEIDTASQQFVAKVFSNGRDVVKYGKLDFSDAGLEVTGVKDKSQKKISLKVRVICNLTYLFHSFSVSIYILPYDHFLSSP